MAEPKDTDAGQAPAPTGAGPGALIGEVSVTEVLGLVGLVLLYVAWQAIFTSLAYGVEGTENRAAVLLAGGVPGLVLVAFGLVTLRATGRAGRNAEAILLLGAPLLIQLGATIVDLVGAESSYAWRTPSGAAVWLAIASLAWLSRRSILTVVGFAASFVLLAESAGQPLLQLALGIDPDSADGALSQYSPGLALAWVGWWSGFGLALFGIARWSRSGSADPANHARRILDAATAFLVVTGPVGLVLGWSTFGERILPAPWPLLLLTAVAALAALAGWRERSAPYYAAAGVLLFVAVLDQATSVGNRGGVGPTLMLAGVATLGLDLAIVVFRRRRSALAGDQSATGGPMAGPIGMTEVLAALGGVLLLISWHVQIEPTDIGPDDWAAARASLAPAIVLGAGALALLPIGPATRRLGGLALLIAGGELARGVAALFGAVTGNESGIGPAIGAAYWLGLAAAAKWRVGTFLTQAGVSIALLAVGLLGGQGVLSIVFGSGEAQYDPVADQYVPTSNHPGFALPLVALGWVAILAVVALWVARRERRTGGPTFERRAMIALSEGTVGLVAVAGTFIAVSQPLSGFDVEVPAWAAAAVVLALAGGFAWAGIRAGSSAFLYSAGLAVLFGAADLNRFVVGDSDVDQGAFILIEAIVILGVAGGVELWRRRRRQPNREAEPTS